MDLLSTQQLIDDRIDRLAREAEAVRLLRVAHSIDDMTPAVWRRVLGLGLRGLSFALGAASSRLDPSLDRGHQVEWRPHRA